MTAETQEKTDRVVRWLEERRLGGVLLSTGPNFAWITGGRSNAVDVTREVGVASALVTADGRRFLLANNIEMTRFLEEELPGDPWTPAELPWTEEMAGASAIGELARGLVGSGAELAADRPLPGSEALDAEIARLRNPLTPAEVERYRALGKDAGEVLGEVCRGLRPGLSETEIARRAVAALGERGAESTVLLVAADDRIGRYRHPIPTGRRWENGVMIVVCARRGGLVVALTRLVWAGPVPEEVRRRTRAAAEVNARLVAATRPGAVARDLFAVAARAYEDLGFPGEERLHHQGGACGYLSRDWIAHPRGTETVEAPQAFAWNPSITGTKVEETWIVAEGSAEVITTTPGWPRLEVEVDGQVYASPDVASLGEV